VSDDPVVDRSEAQKVARVEALRAELAELGYVIVRKDDVTWLRRALKRLAEQLPAE
jgi:hypothetical protein